jgi:hypothetical protein
MQSYLNQLDSTKADLQQQFPGWHIWYVPGMNRTVTWCAQPWPLLNTGSPEHLAAAITEAHEVAAAAWRFRSCSLNRILLVAAVIALLSGAISVAAIRGRDFAQQQRPG